MTPVLHKYSGAGNDFMVADGRCSDVGHLRKPAEVARICEENFTDGLMILTGSDRFDFAMEFYNPDGSGGMMCGNGGRCIVAFAASLGIAPGSGADELARIGLHDDEYLFEGPDGLHTAVLLSKPAYGLSLPSEGVVVRLRMKDVLAVEEHQSLPGLPDIGGLFMNTGTRHFVSFMDDVAGVNMAVQGRGVRNCPVFAPEGTNADFVSVDPDGNLRVRTFEKGVEGETLACGTGIVAAAIAARHKEIKPFAHAGRRVRYIVRARRDSLAVDFVFMKIMDWKRREANMAAVDVYLTGPAAEIEI